MKYRNLHTAVMGKYQNINIMCPNLKLNDDHWHTVDTVV